MTIRSDPPPGGFTLVELLAALTILGSVLAATIVARGRFAHQTSLAERRLAAVAVADALLTRWWAQPDRMPRQGQGAADGFQWRTRTASTPQSEQVSAEVLTLTLWSERQPPEDGPALSIDVLIEREDSRSAAAGEGGST